VVIWAINTLLLAGIGPEAPARQAHAPLVNVNEFPLADPSPKTFISHTMPYEKSVHIDGLELGLFADYNLSTGPLHTSFGIRADYYTLLGDMAFSPRISSVLSFGDFGNLLAGFGIYHQFPTDLPTIIFTNTNSLPPDSIKNHELTYLNKAQPERCYQASAGYDVVLRDAVQTKLAVYYKLYDHEYHYLLPNGNPYLVPYQPDFSYIRNGQQDGRRRSFGCEWSAGNINKTWYFYSMGLSVFDVKTQFDNNKWYNDWTNVEYTGSLSMGATLLHDHTFSLSAQGSGGRPYCQGVIYTDCLNRQLDSLLSTQSYYTKRLAYLLTINGRYGFTKKIFGVELETFLEVINMLNYKPALDYQFNGVSFVAIRPFGITPILGLDVHF